MPYRQILEWPNPLLREKASRVEDFGKDTSLIIKDLEDTLLVKQGGGLAATQIGYSQRVMVIDCSMFDSDFINPESESSTLDNKNMWVLINPEIKSSEGSVSWQEGCLSVPWHNATVKRFKTVKITYQSSTGDHKEVLLDYPIAAAFQHEFDHLEGKLYLDRISRLTSARIKNSIIKKRKKLSKIKAEIMSLNSGDSRNKKIKRVKKNSHLSKKEIKKRRSRKRAAR